MKRNLENRFDCKIKLKRYKTVSNGNFIVKRNIYFRNSDIYFFIVVLKTYLVTKCERLIYISLL